MATDDVTRTGYSREEEYFYKKNRELIERKRKELDAQRAAREATQGASAHWMRCPKCAERMEEVPLASIKIDRCTSCNGVYFDAGELHTLLESSDPHEFLGSLKRVVP